MCGTASRAAASPAAMSSALRRISSQRMCPTRGDGEGEIALAFEDDRAARVEIGRDSGEWNPQVLDPRDGKLRAHILLHSRVRLHAEARERHATEVAPAHTEREAF